MLSPLPRSPTRLTVLLFGPAASALGADRLSIELPGQAPTAREVLDAVTAAPALAGVAGSLAGARLARNGSFAAPDEHVSPTDELALIALVSGG